MATHVKALAECEKSQLVYDKIEDQRKAEYNEILSRLKHDILDLKRFVQQLILCPSLKIFLSIII